MSRSAIFVVSGASHNFLIDERFIKPLTIYKQNARIRSGNSYHVKCSVSEADFETFLKALKGQRAVVTVDNAEPLSCLSDEFGFRGLDSKIALVWNKTTNPPSGRPRTKVRPSSRSTSEHDSLVGSTSGPTCESESELQSPANVKTTKREPVMDVGDLRSRVRMVQTTIDDAKTESNAKIAALSAELIAIRTEQTKANETLSERMTNVERDSAAVRQMVDELGLSIPGSLLQRLKAMEDANAAMKLCIEQAMTTNGTRVAAFSSLIGEVEGSKKIDGIASELSVLKKVVDRVVMEQTDGNEAINKMKEVVECDVDSMKIVVNQLESQQRALIEVQAHVVSFGKSQRGKVDVQNQEKK